jgi:hypothetical protein
MLYKPKFCCNCGEKIDRIEWNLLTSRRFCDVCSTEQKRHDNFPRAVVAGGLLALTFGFGSLFGGSNGASTAQTLNASPAQLKAQAPEKQPESAPTQRAQITQSATFQPGQPADVSPSRQPETASPEKAYYCGALTKKGTPCSRKVKAPGSRCYQHEGKPAAVPES